MRKFLQPLLIGELAPEEPSQDGAQNVSRAWRRPSHLGGLGGMAIAAPAAVPQGDQGHGCLPAPPRQAVEGEPARSPSLLWAASPSTASVLTS